MENLSGGNKSQLSEKEFLISKTIICCDDDDNILSYINGVLGRYCTLATFNRGSKVKNFCIAHKTDLILLDVHMPPPNGFAVLNILKEDKRTRDIPVIRFTSEARKSEIKKIISSGASDYLIKPSPPKVIRERIIEVLLKHSPNLKDEIIITKSADEPKKISVRSSSKDVPVDEFDYILSAVKNIQIGFSGPETIEWGYKNILEGVMNISKLNGAGGIFCKSLYDDTLRLAGTKNAVNINVKKLFDEKQEELKEYFEKEKKKFFSFAENKVHWTAIALVVADEIYGVILLQIPEKAWEPILTQDKTLESFLVLST